MIAATVVDTIDASFVMCIVPPLAVPVAPLLALRSLLRDVQHEVIDVLVFGPEFFEGLEPFCRELCGCSS